MAGGKAQSDVDDVKLLLAREFHGFGRGGDDGFGSRDKSQNTFLKIESKQRCLFRIQFHESPFRIYMSSPKINAMSPRRMAHRPHRRRSRPELSA
jgi:hypothetical protein